MTATKVAVLPKKVGSVGVVKSIGDLADRHARFAVGKKLIVKFILLIPYIPGWWPNSSAPTKKGDRNNGSDTVNCTYTRVATVVGTPLAVIPPSVEV